MNTKTISVGTKDSKLEFTIGQPFEPGHVCSEADAKILNQIRAENINNNIRGKVQDTLTGAKDALSESALRDFVTKYDAEYVFTLAGAGGTVVKLTPVERAARDIAQTIVLASIAKQGKKRKDIDKERFASEVARIAATDKVVTLAKKQVRELEKVAAEALEVAA